MKKIFKSFFAVAVAFIFCSGSAWAVGAGVQLGANPKISLTSKGSELNSIEGSAIGTIKCSRFPISFGFGLSFTYNLSDFEFGGTGYVDYWALDKQIKNNFNIYSGFGFGNSFTILNKQEVSDYISSRFFVGLNWLFLDNYIEFYVQQNICPGINFNFTTLNSNFLISTPFETGVRWHF